MAANANVLHGAPTLCSASCTSDQMVHVNASSASCDMAMSHNIVYAVTVMELALKRVSVCVAVCRES